MENPKADRKKKVLWTPEEDEKLCALIEKLGSVSWTTISREMKTRNSKQCRERWINVLSPDVNWEQWSSYEDTLILEYARVHGNKWAQVSKLLNGRSANAIKNICRRNASNKPKPAALPQPESYAVPAPCLLDLNSHQLFYLVPVMTIA